MDVSVIIVNYNTYRITSDCIESIFKYTNNVDFEVILVDNASTDRSTEFFAKDKRIKYIQNKENLGFGRANNIGYQEASGKYIFLLNSDTLLKNNAIKIFYDTAEKSSNQIACFGCILRNKDLQSAHSYGDFTGVGKEIAQELINITSFLFKIKLQQKTVSFKETRLPFYVDDISGAALFIRKEIIEKFGLFDPAYFLYMEEVDLQRKYAVQGYKNQIIDGPVIVHLEGGSSATERSKSLKISTFALKSKLIYYKKWESPIKYYSYRIVLLLVRIPFLIFSSYSSDEKSSYWKTLTGLYKRNKR